MCKMPETHLSGKYKLIKLLNHGPYSKVYHAKDTLTGQNVAIKTLECTKNLEVEIQAMSRLNHPHIIKLIEILAGTDQVYMVTEFAKCGDLFEKIASKGKFNEDLSRHYFQQLISAVKHCHIRGVFHRDIKPENILLDDKLNLKLSDFGHCALSEDSAKASTTTLWGPCGTVEYAAPEVMAKRGGYDGAKADVWSCGVVLFVLSAGFLPFDGSDVNDMLGKMKKRDFRMPKWMSPGLKWLLLRMLDPSPESRISIDEILEDGWFSQGYEEEVEQ